MHDTSKSLSSQRDEIESRQSIKKSQLANCRKCNIHSRFVLYSIFFCFKFAFQSLINRNWMQIFTQQQNQIKLIIELRRASSLSLSHSSLHCNRSCVYVREMFASTSWKWNISISSHFVTVFNHLLMPALLAHTGLISHFLWDSALGGSRKCASLVDDRFATAQERCVCSYIKHTFPVPLSSQIVMISRLSARLLVLYVMRLLLLLLRVLKLSWVRLCSSNDVWLPSKLQKMQLKNIFFTFSNSP